MFPFSKKKTSVGAVQAAPVETSASQRKKDKLRSGDLVKWEVVTLAEPTGAPEEPVKTSVEQRDVIFSGWDGENAIIRLPDGAFKTIEGTKGLSW